MKNSLPTRRTKRPFSFQFRLLKDDGFKRVEVVIEKGPVPQEKKDEPEFVRIRCPKCRWRPDGMARWQCSYCPEPENFFGGCGAIWNTFETRGLCPDCRHQWRWTSCPSCCQWSLHEDWYETVRRRD